MTDKLLLINSDWLFIARLDSVWGGEDDLVSAHAWEEDGNTRMRFLKKVSGGPGDHDMAGSLLVVWAHGQLDTFYKEDQLKFHSRSNRGVTSLGEFLYYLNCQALTLIDIKSNYD